MVSTTARPVPDSSISRCATQRVALPQAPASLPSGLRICMKAVAPGVFGGWITMN